MGKTRHVASGSDVVAVQAGTVTRKRAGESIPVVIETTTDATVVNIRSGNARVGIQADSITGPITIRMDW